MVWHAGSQVEQASTSDDLFRDEAVHGGKKYDSYASLLVCVGFMYAPIHPGVRV